MRILYDPAPRTTSEIFSEESEQEFFENYDVIRIEDGARDELYEEYLPTTDILIGQQEMDRGRLEAAPNLRAIFNVETNFLPNIDYDYCFERGIHVLAPSSVFAIPVAEHGLGLALSLARGIHTGHIDFLAGTEKYGLEGNQDALLLTGSDIGFIGFGDLGRALKTLIAPFQARIRVYDPWLPDGYLRRLGVEPANFEDVMRNSRLIFVVAAITKENSHLLDAEALSLVQDQGILVLLSRAAIADFEALRAEAGSGRLRIATDVFPEEPVAADDPIRKTDGMLLSAHRAGAMTEALQQIGELVLEDLSLIAQGLPPVACRRAERETVKALRSKPIDKT